IARAANAILYENWTDVSGFRMADPRIVENPLGIDTITYRELRELSYMGATVLHEDAIFPVQFAGIPINIKNTNAPEERGTMIVPAADDYDKKHIITGIAGRHGFCALNIEKDRMNSEIGFGRKVLEVLENEGICFEHLPSGIDTMSVVINSHELEGHKERVVSGICRSVAPDSVGIEEGISLLAVVGRGMVKNTGTAARVFRAIADAGINIRMIDQGSSELSIIIAVADEDLAGAIRAIYREFV
ncbi:MAG: ACT domain-containing protein, partial [Clostridia bacterium]|nr:ACT domain-containing protein [Clostridia bacterium]